MTSTPTQPSTWREVGKWRRMRAARVNELEARLGQQSTPARTLYATRDIELCERIVTLEREVESAGMFGERGTR